MNVEQLFKPDLEIIQAHLFSLFDLAMDEYPNGLIQIDDGDPNSKSWEFRYFPLDEIHEAAEYAAERNALERNVYVGLNPRKPDTDMSRAARNSDIEVSFFHVADIDKPVSLKKEIPLKPTFSVVTGKTPSDRGHYYWQLENASFNLDQWSIQQEAIAKHFQSDNIKDPRRILRLAGTISYPTPKKKGHGYGIEKVSLRTHEDRDPVDANTVWLYYPYKTEDPVKLNLAIHDTTIPDHVFEEKILADDEWNNNAFALVGRFVLRGMSDAQILERAKGWTIPQRTSKDPIYTEADTIREIADMIRRTRKKQAEGQFGSIEEPPMEQTESDIDLKPLGVLQPRLRKKRSFIVPNRLMRGHVTLTSAPPGVGKTLHAIQEAVSLVSGIDFMGVGITGKHKVAIINNEESRDELERRIEATCIAFSVDFGEIAEGLFLHSGVDAKKFVIAKEVGGSVVYTPHQEKVHALINHLKIDVLVLDPFVQTHFVSENANEAISRVMVGMREMLVGEHQSALNLVHHIRKPQAGTNHTAGDMFSARGAGAMQGEAHFVYTLADMNSKEAEKLGVADDDKGWYLRLDDAKAKLAPPGTAQWFEREGVEIPRQIGSEEVGALIPWTPPDNPLHVTSATAQEILRVIDSRWKNGKAFTKTGDRSLLRFIVKEHGLTRLSAKNLLRQWDDNDVLAYGVIDKHRKTMGYAVTKWPGKVEK